MNNQEIEDSVEEIRNLKEGWLDGEGHPASEELISKARKVAYKALEIYKEIPFLSLSPCGSGIDVEWDDGKVRYGIMVDSSESIEIMGVNRNADIVKHGFFTLEGFLKMSPNTTTKVAKE